jgi:hypothetical protein
LGTTFEEVQSGISPDTLRQTVGGISMLVGRKLFIIFVTLFSFVGSAHAREATRLTDAQLDKVTAGVEGIRLPPMSSFLSNNNSGISQFSPAVATLVPTLTNLNICVICINAR